MGHKTPVTVQSTHINKQTNGKSTECKASAINRSEVSMIYGVPTSHDLCYQFNLKENTIACKYQKALKHIIIGQAFRRY